jgi:hypothetical protein
MSKIQCLLGTVLVSSALTAIAAQPAFADADLTLESFSFTDLNVYGTAPKIVDNRANVSTSNAGNVTTVTLPYVFDFTGLPGSSVTPKGPLFVVEPENTRGTSTATIQVTFTFKYNANPTFTLVEDLDYTANASNDYDSLIWQPGTNGGTCSGYLVTSHCTYDFADGGQNFSITMDDETDWNMAEFDAATVDLGPTQVPEPASIAMFGAGLLGLGMVWRRRRQRMTRASV